MTQSQKPTCEHSQVGFFRMFLSMNAAAMIFLTGGSIWIFRFRFDPDQSKNLSWMARRAFSLSARSMSTEILISEVEIIWMLIWL